MRFGLHFLAGGLMVYVACSAAGGGESSALAGGSSSGSRLKASFYKGDDGSKAVVVSMWDSDRGESCFFQLAPDGKLRCMPAGGPKAGVDPSAYVAGTEQHE